MIYYYDEKKVFKDVDEITQYLNSVNKLYIRIRLELNYKDIELDAEILKYIKEAKETTFEVYSIVIKYMKNDDISYSLGDVKSCIKEKLEAVSYKNGGELFLRNIWTQF